jgi:hypothetical protein
MITKKKSTPAIAAMAARSERETEIKAEFIVRFRRKLADAS